MQSRVIVNGEPLLVNDVAEQVKQPGGVYYDVDREGRLRKVPEEGAPGVRAAMMLPVKHEGEVVGVVQLHNADAEYDEELRPRLQPERAPRRSPRRARTRRVSSRRSATESSCSTKRARSASGTAPRSWSPAASARTSAAGR